jgi:hypothetical protein
VRVSAERLHLRAEPGTKSEVLRMLRPGEVLVPLECSGLDLDDYTWWRVTGEDGQVGWAATKWLERAE